VFGIRFGGTTGQFGGTTGLEVAVGRRLGFALVFVGLFLLFFGLFERFFAFPRLQ